MKINDQIKKLSHDLRVAKKRFVIIVMDDKNTMTKSSLDTDRDILRASAAIGRTAQRRIERSKP
jgi:hypothetical protein